MPPAVRTYESVPYRHIGGTPQTAIHDIKMTDAVPGEA
jgi:hypothetical protein